MALNIMMLNKLSINISKPHIMEILVRANIDPKNIISVVEIDKIQCPWCQQRCGHLAQILPCDHHICADCIDSVVDSGEEFCPHCHIVIENISWC